MVTKKIHWKRRGRKPQNLERLQRLKDYAAAEYVDESTVRNWIARNRIIGYYIKGRWWIDPESRYKFPLYHSR